MIIAKEKAVVVPGEPLAEGMEYLPSFGTYREGDKIRASRMGLFALDNKVLRVIPLSGRYNPKKGDMIIAKVTEISFSTWRLELNTAYTAMLNVKEATSDFVARDFDITGLLNMSDYIVCKITNVTASKLIDVSMRGPGLRKLKGGRIIPVNPSKVPRIIGKQGSMIQMIKEQTGSKIIVGQNGWIWLDNEDPKMELLATKTIRKIEAEGHMPGLTDRIKEYLDKEIKK